MTRRVTTPIAVFLLALLVETSSVTWSAQADLAARIETFEGRASVIEGRSLSVDAAVLSSGPDLAANVQLSIGGSSGGSGCVIKAAYGNSLAPELDSLRWFRDRWLLGSPIGRAIVKYYYAVSPVIADWIA